MNKSKKRVVSDVDAHHNKLAKLMYIVPNKVLIQQKTYKLRKAQGVKVGCE